MLNYCIVISTLLFIGLIYNIYVNFELYKLLFCVYLCVLGVIFTIWLLFWFFVVRKMKFYKEIMGNK